MKVFHSKIDAFFMKLIAVVILLIGIFTFLPLIIDRKLDFSIILMLAILFLVIVTFILWTVLSIEYRFYDNYLFVKGGPFRSLIEYEDISKFSLTTEVLGGYTVLSARNSIEIFYSKSMLGSVKISPHDQYAFLTELKKRCPHLKT